MKLKHIKSYLLKNSLNIFYWYTLIKYILCENINTQLYWYYFEIKLHIEFIIIH